MALLLIELDVLEIILYSALLSEPFIGLRNRIIIEDASVNRVLIDAFFVLDSLPFACVYEELQVCDRRLKEVSDSYGTHVSRHGFLWFFEVHYSLIEHRPRVCLFWETGGMLRVYVYRLGLVTFLLAFVQNHHKITGFQPSNFINKIRLFISNIIFLTKFVEQVRIFEQQIFTLNVQYFEIAHKITRVFQICAVCDFVGKCVAGSAQMDSGLSYYVGLLIVYVIVFFVIFNAISLKIIFCKIVFHDIFGEHFLTSHDLEVVAAVFIGEIKETYGP